MATPQDWNEAGARWEEQRPDDVPVRLEVEVVSAASVFGDLPAPRDTTPGVEFVARVAIRDGGFVGQTLVTWEVAVADVTRVIDLITASFAHRELWDQLSGADATMLKHWVWERLSGR